MGRCTRWGSEKDRKTRRRLAWIRARLRGLAADFKTMSAQDTAQARSCLRAKRPDRVLANRLLCRADVYRQTVARISMILDYTEVTIDLGEAVEKNLREMTQKRVP